MCVVQGAPGELESKHVVQGEPEELGSLHVVQGGPEELGSLYVVQGVPKAQGLGQGVVVVEQAAIEQLQVCSHKFFFWVLHCRSACIHTG